MPTRAAAIAPLIFLWSLTGCSVPSRVVDIDSTPPETRGASIYVNGVKQGSTPYKASVEFPTKDGRALIQVVKPNYKPVLEYWTLSTVPEKRREFILEDE